MHQQGLINALKQRREILGVTQSHLADLAGVGVRTLKEIESGKGNPTVETLIKLAEVLGMEQPSKPKYRALIGFECMAFLEVVKHSLKIGLPDR